jgi:hypothetical protein
MQFYPRFLVPSQTREPKMKRNSVAVQADLFNNVPAPPAFSNSHPRHDELVELLAKLLREVVQIPLEQTQIEGGSHDQD